MRTHPKGEALTDLDPRELSRALPVNPDSTSATRRDVVLLSTTTCEHRQTLLDLRLHLHESVQRLPTTFVLGERSDREGNGGGACAHGGFRGGAR